MSTKAEAPIAAAIHQPEFVGKQLTLKEIAELLIRHNNLTSGFYEASVEINFTVGNVGITPDQAKPSAIVSFSRIGLARAASDAPMAVDASKVSRLPIGNE